MSQMDLTKDESDWVEEMVLAFFCFSGCAVFFCLGMVVFSNYEIFVDYFMKSANFEVRLVYSFQSESLPFGAGRSDLLRPALNEYIPAGLNFLPCLIHLLFMPSFRNFRYIFKTASHINQ